MKKRLLLFLLFLGFGIPTMAQVKVGYMNPNAVFASLPEVADIEKQIQELINTRDQELAAQQAQLQQELAAYEEVRATLSAEEQAAREQDLLDKNQELENSQQTYLNEIRQRRATLMQPIIERMDNAIKEVAQSLDLDLVLNEGTSYGDAIIFYAGTESLNITDRVLAKLLSDE